LLIFSKGEHIMLKVGIVGMGMMGGFHAPRYRHVPNAQVVAIADLRPERLKAKEAVAGNIASDEGPFDPSRVARYGDASALIAEGGVDIVDICLPTFLHAPYAIEALQAGKHVLCEKPMALNVEQADRMIAAAKQADRKLMIAQCIRFWPEYRFLRQAVQDGRYGRLLSLNMFRMGGRPIWSWENWFTDPARSGGTMLDLHIHDVDYVNFLLGLPDRIQVVGRQTEATGSYDVVHAVYDYQDGPQVHMHAGWSMAQIPFNAGFDAWFERGFIRFDGKNDPPLTVFDDLVHANGHEPEYERGDAYAAEIAYFCECVAQNKAPDECPPESARDSVALIYREQKAIAAGTAVSGK
jgi:predicted dehydrogenase